jgi:hypothetical protein
MRIRMEWSHRHRRSHQGRWGMRIREDRRRVKLLAAAVLPLWFLRPQAAYGTFHSATCPSQRVQWTLPGTSRRARVPGQFAPVAPAPSRTMRGRRVHWNRAWAASPHCTVRLPANEDFPPASCLRDAAGCRCSRTCLDVERRSPGNASLCMGGVHRTQ